MMEWDAEVHVRIKPETKPQFFRFSSLNISQKPGNAAMLGQASLFVQSGDWGTSHQGLPQHFLQPFCSISQADTIYTFIML